MLKIYRRKGSQIMNMVNIQTKDKLKYTPVADCSNTDYKA